MHRCQMRQGEEYNDTIPFSPLSYPRRLKKKTWPHKYVSFYDEQRIIRQPNATNNLEIGYLPIGYSLRKLLPVKHLRYRMT